MVITMRPNSNYGVALPMHARARALKSKKRFFKFVADSPKPLVGQELERLFESSGSWYRDQVGTPTVGLSGSD